MKTRILVLGAQGMAGHVMKLSLSQYAQYDVIGVARTADNDNIACDVSDSEALRKVIESHLPNIVINCVGVLVGASDKNPCNAILLNSYLPHFLAKLGKEYNYKLFHISTDCVFSGHRGGYTEDDFRDGDTMYARSKALGEIIDDRNCTIRTSIIGPELKVNGTGLFHWFMQQTGTIKGYSKAFWSGVTTIELAKFVHYAIESKLTGLLELTMSEKISKYDLLNLFKEVWQKTDITIIPNDAYHCDKSMISIRKDIVYGLPRNYKHMLTEQAEWMDKHHQTYNYTRLNYE